MTSCSSVVAYPLTPRYGSHAFSAGMRGLGSIFRLLTICVSPRMRAPRRLSVKSKGVTCNRHRLTKRSYGVSVVAAEALSLDPIAEDLGHRVAVDFQHHRVPLPRTPRSSSRTCSNWAPDWRTQSRV